MQKVAVQRSILVLTFLVVGLLAAFVTSAATAQARPQEEIVYRIVAVDANSWVVTAEDQQTGNQVRFKLNPRAFVNKKFKADLQGKGQGHRFSVTAPRNEPLSNCCAMSGGPPGETPSRGPSTRRPTAQGRRGAPPTSRPGRPSAGPGGPGAPGGGNDFEIVEVDPKTWTVTASGVGSGQTVRFRVDPSSFVGYEFRANLRDLHRGQGFGMIGLNSSPLSGCCTLLSGGS